MPSLHPWPKWQQALLEAPNAMVAEAVGYWCFALADDARRRFVQEWLGRPFDVYTNNSGEYEVSEDGGAVLGLTRATLFKDGTWQPNDGNERDGVPVITYPCIVGEADCRPQCFDIVAIDVGPEANRFYSDRDCYARIDMVGMLYNPPDCWQTWTAFDPADLEGGAVRVFRFATDWLRAGRPEGSIVILDYWDNDVLQLLAMADAGKVALIVDDDDHAKELRAQIRPRRAPLKIGVA